MVRKFHLMMLLENISMSLTMRSYILWRLFIYNVAFGCMYTLYQTISKNKKFGLVDIFTLALSFGVMFDNLCRINISVVQGLHLLFSNTKSHIKFVNWLLESDTPSIKIHIHDPILILEITSLEFLLLVPEWHCQFFKLFFKIETFEGLRQYSKL